MRRGVRMRPGMRKNSRAWAWVIGLATMVAINGGAADRTAVTKSTVRAGDGVNIVCESRGKGETTLLFLHGWCGDRHWWKNQVDEFARDYRVVAIDQAGHGESGKDRKEWTLDSLSKDVERVVKELGLKRVIMVGHSMGGPIALGAAKGLPGRVAAVVGIDTLQNAEYKASEEDLKKFLEAFETDFAGTLRAAMQGMLPDNVDTNLSNWIVTGAEKQDRRMAMGLMRAFGRVDLKSLFREAKVPVRCINAAPGAFKFGIPTAAAVNKRYADFEVVIIEGTGHFPMLEKPAEFNRKLRTVLSEFAAKN